MNTYTPQPLDTSVVTLPPTLTALTVKLAENTHYVWAVTRIAQGWTYGPNRDDAKQHACLVPYADLPESEEDYDRRTAGETLKAIVAL